MSDEELLEHLKRLYAEAGQLSGVLIDQAPDMPSSATYRSRFGSLARAYEMIGYRTDRDQERIALNKRLPHDAALYKKRHMIENIFGRMKNWRRIAMRFDRRANIFLSACALAAIVLFWLCLLNLDGPSSVLRLT